MSFLYANRARTLLARSITPKDTTLSLMSGTGAVFPAITTPEDSFAITLISATSPNQFEIVYCVSRNGDALTVVRGQEGTTALPFQSGDVASLNMTAALYRRLPQAGYLGQFSQEIAQSPGGYRKGAIVCDGAPGIYWISLSDENTTTPGTDNASWQQLDTGHLVHADDLNRYLPTDGSRWMSGQLVVAAGEMKDGNNADGVSVRFRDGSISGTFTVGLDQQNYPYTLLSFFDQNGGFHAWQFGVHDRITTPSGGTVLETLLAQDGHLWAHNYGGPDRQLAWLSDVEALKDANAAAQPAGNYLVCTGDRARKAQAFTVNAVHGQWIDFPEAFSDNDVHVDFSVQDTGGNRIHVVNWFEVTRTGFRISLNVWNGSSLVNEWNATPVKIRAEGYR